MAGAVDANSTALSSIPGEEVWSRVGELVDSWPEMYQQRQSREAVIEARHSIRAIANAEAYLDSFSFAPTTSASEVESQIRTPIGGSAPLGTAVHYLTQEHHLHPNQMNVASHGPPRYPSDSARDLGPGPGHALHPSMPPPQGYDSAPNFDSANFDDPRARPYSTHPPQPQPALYYDSYLPTHPPQYQYEASNTAYARPTPSRYPSHESDANSQWSNQASWSGVDATGSSTHSLSTISPVTSDYASPPEKVQHPDSYSFQGAVPMPPPLTSAAEPYLSSHPPPLVDAQPGWISTRVPQVAPSNHPSQFNDPNDWIHHQRQQQREQQQRRQQGLLSHPSEPDSDPRRHLYTLGRYETSPPLASETSETPHEDVRVMPPHHDSEAYRNGHGRPLIDSSSTLDHFRAPAPSYTTPLHQWDPPPALVEYPLKHVNGASEALTNGANVYLGPHSTGTTASSAPYDAMDHPSGRVDLESLMAGASSGESGQGAVGYVDDNGGRVQQPHQRRSETDSNSPSSHLPSPTSTTSNDQTPYQTNQTAGALPADAVELAVGAKAPRPSKGDLGPWPPAATTIDPAKKAKTEVRAIPLKTKEKTGEHEGGGNLTSVVVLAPSGRKGAKRLTSEISVFCLGCTRPVARIICRGSESELNVPHRAAYTCINCNNEAYSSNGSPSLADETDQLAATQTPPTAAVSSPSSAVPSPATIDTFGQPIMNEPPAEPAIKVSASFRKRHKRDDLETTSCDVCLRDIASGAVVANNQKQRIDFHVEVVCSHCDSMYQRCSDCGGGGGLRLGVGKWRCKQLFVGNRKTCSLSHLRLGAMSDMLYDVVAIRDIPKDEAEELSEIGQRIFSNTLLGNIAIPEVIEQQSSIAKTFDEVVMMATHGWRMINPLLKVDVEATQNTRRYLCMRSCAPNPRKSSKSVAPPEPSRDGRPRVVLREGKEVVGFILAEWDIFTASLLLSVVVPWSTGETYDATSILIQHLLQRVEKDRLEMNVERKERGLEAVPPVARTWTMTNTSTTYKRGFKLLDDYLKEDPTAKAEWFPPHRPVYLPVERQHGWVVLVRPHSALLAGFAPRRTPEELMQKNKEKRVRARRGELADDDSS
ncbi:BZ3500_MvSof-1268-A1-R1_Chr1-1g01138 [Microbotryum saponariae]|uniref:BZ3500_MvSof-1268-A1-R1_Chr1-1g01138 protein n=1 Tax=Microbotryum saponariae TaxID=289078 RepID=A0A2X0L418_9BASI|nr:BZ3500_MvSof-1268-A1-R1_Chr1-1g01138 [Microbotryum saponariae]SCZ93481.1 BZ3501_MvSof-1269-A2-R1_Chr1-1g00735 [Microbotryum saponariae]